MDEQSMYTRGGPNAVLNRSVSHVKENEKFSMGTSMVSFARRGWIIS